MDYAILKELNHWLKYISTCENVDWNDFDRVQYIYNSFDVNWVPNRINVRWAAKAHALVHNAFKQYKLLAENVSIYSANPRIDIIFDNLEYNLQQLDFWRGDDDDDEDEDEDDSSDDEDDVIEVSDSDSSDDDDDDVEEDDADIMDSVLIMPQYE
jgi:hypothetical protein